MKTCPLVTSFIYQKLRSSSCVSLLISKQPYRSLTLFHYLFNYFASVSIFFANKNIHIRIMYEILNINISVTLHEYNGSKFFIKFDYLFNLLDTFLIISYLWIILFSRRNFIGYFNIVLKMAIFIMKFQQWFKFSLWTNKGYFKTFYD